MTYDQWKTRDPNEPYYDYEVDSCEHEDAETDCLDGRVYCHRCGESWYATAEELAAEHQRVAEYAQWVERESRREFWRKLTLPIRWPLFRMLERLWPRKACSVLTDDEIPF